MPTLAVTGIGTAVSGDLDTPLLPGVQAVLCRDGVIERIGGPEELAAEVDAADQVLDAAGSTVAPGLIDSHGHVAFGDYTPRQQAVGFLAGMVHGGVTRLISAGEVHVPGRPRDRAGVKALAVAARACYENFRPGGLRVHAGTVLLEPTLLEPDFADLARDGVWLAKFGFGAYHRARDGVDQVRWAQQHGLRVMCHAGGPSPAGSASLTYADLVLLAPDVVGHANGGPTALPDADVDRLLHETAMTLQVVQAGNLRAGLRLTRAADAAGLLHRVVIGSDTPSGFGVMPLAVLKTLTDLTALAPLDPARAWALATGTVADTWRLPAGRLRPGAAADLVVLDAPAGSVATTALGAMAVGDVPAVSAVITGGEVSVLGSRNTPRARRPPSLTGRPGPV